jgi:predicted transcriptional regulator
MIEPKVVLTVRVSRAGRDRVAALAEKHRLRPSDVARRALAAGLPVLERELARRRPAGEPLD